MCNYCEKMDIAKALDFAIRDYELNNMIIGPSDVPYIIKTENGKREYWNYMSNDSWESFKEHAMTIEHRNNYKDAKGGELDPRNSRWGMLPPKMASFGSSSRMIYCLSKDMPGFVFEKQMPTYVGHDANLDGYLLSDNTAIFVEAKCREIYSSHANLDINEVYKNVYNYIHEKNPKFGFDEEKSKEQNCFKCTFHYDDKVIKHFDIKQLICHFLGITAALIDNKDNKIASNTIKFIYLIFNPNYNTDFSHDAIKKYEKKLKDQYNESIKEIDKFGNMKWLFNSIMEFQVNENKKLKLTNENLKLPNYSFSFELMDQEKYKNYLEKISCQTPLHI